MTAAWIDTHDGVALGAMLRQGTISSTELLEAVLARIEQRNPSINAIALRMDAMARAQAAAYRPETARSPLSGVPLFVKDLLADIAGVPTLNGTRACQQLPLPRQDAEIIRRYRAAGLVLAAKTTTPEQGLTPCTESELYGDTRNPWDLTRTPGGSSGGSAAAVAARMVPLAHGGDGGGSIRIPASHCGLFGLRPGRGRSPDTPLYAELWQGFVTEHAITRSVRDSAAMLDILCDSQGYRRTPLYHIAPPPPEGYLQALQQPVRPLRIAVSLQPFTGGKVCQDACQAVEQAATLLRQLGHDVQEARPPLASPDTLARVMEVVLVGSLAQIARDWRQATGRRLHWRDVEPATWALARAGEQTSAGALAWARETALQQGLIMQDFHQQWDMLLTPVMNQLPAPLGTLGLPGWQASLSRLLVGRLGMDWLLKVSPMMEQGLERMMHYMGWTIVANMTGQPAMSVPLYWSAPTRTAPAGLPVGCMFTGRMGDEVTLLQLARQLEQARPWWEQSPVLPA